MKESVQNTFEKLIYIFDIFLMVSIENFKLKNILTFFLIYENNLPRMIFVRRMSQPHVSRGVNWGCYLNQVPTCKLQTGLQPR